MRKYGFSFSWKRAIGLPAAKGRLSRRIGIPLTRAGRQQKNRKNDWLLNSFISVFDCVGSGIECFIDFFEPVVNAPTRALAERLTELCDRGC
jgi:hypothetical protein